MKGVIIVLIAAIVAVSGLLTNEEICSGLATNCAACVLLQSGNSANDGYPNCQFCDATGVSEGDFCQTNVDICDGNIYNPTDSGNTCDVSAAGGDTCSQYSSSDCGGCITHTGCGWCGWKSDNTGFCASGTGSGPSSGACPDELGGWRFAGTNEMCTYNYSLSTLGAGQNFFINGAGIAVATQTLTPAYPGSHLSVAVFSTTSHPICISEDASTCSAASIYYPDEGAATIVGHIEYDIPDGLTDVTIRSQNDFGIMILTIPIIQEPSSSTGSTEMSSSSTGTDMTSSSSTGSVVASSSSTGSTEASSSTATSQDSSSTASTQASSSSTGSTQASSSSGSTVVTSSSGSTQASSSGSAAASSTASSQGSSTGQHLSAAPSSSSIGLATVAVVAVATLAALN